MNRATGPICAPLLAVVGMSIDRPAARRKIHMKGKVAKVRVRRPLVSIIKSVGMVATT
jgi:hypothetical protein